MKATNGAGSSSSKSLFPPPAAPGRSPTPTRLYRASSRSDERSPSPARIFRSASRDTSSAASGDRSIFRTASKDSTSTADTRSLTPSRVFSPPTNQRSAKNVRSEGKPPTASSGRSVTALENRRVFSDTKSSLPTIPVTPTADRNKKEKEDPIEDDAGSIADRENTNRGNTNVQPASNNEMVQQSSFWDQAANALNDLTSPPKKPNHHPGYGTTAHHYSSSASASSGSSGGAQNRNTYETARGGDGDATRGEQREEVDTSSMPSVSSETPTSLYSLIRARNWADVVSHCKVDKSEAGTWVVERNTNGTVRWRLLPLHQACEMQPPEEVVKALIVAYPPAVQMKDSGGDLPLHLACRERATKDVVHTLLRADPDTAGVADDEGRLPLHLACRQGAGIDIVDDLLSTYHRGAKTADSYGLLPLHWACAQNATVPIVESLLRAHPYAVDVKDKWGRTPLSLAHASTNAEKDRIVAALGKDASYWTTSLKNEVEDLRGRLDTASVRAQRESEKATGLEAKLAEVMAASSEAALSFQSLRTELEEENALLRGEVEELRPRIEQSDERIQYLDERNARLRDQVSVLAEKLGHLTDVFREMEEQRLQVLRVTGEWEDSLQRAAGLVLLDEGEEDGEGDANQESYAANENMK